MRRPLFHHFTGVIRVKQITSAGHLCEEQNAARAPHIVPASLQSINDIGAADEVGGHEIGPGSNVVDACHLRARNLSDVGKFSVLEDEQIGLVGRLAKRRPCFGGPVIDEVHVGFECGNVGADGLHQFKQPRHGVPVGC